MSPEIPVRRAIINESNGFVVSECPKTGRPTFTHTEKGCINCESHVSTSEETLICNHGEKETTAKALENARAILRNLKERQEK